MEAANVLHNRSPFLHSFRPKVNYSARCVTRLIDEVEKKTNTKTIYKDGWLNLVAINHLSQAVQSTTGLRNNKSGYESLVEAARATSRKFGPTEQRELVIKALDKAFPKHILALIRMLLPNSKFTREYFAVFTTVFFTWLVGPCETRESELNRESERNVVYIKKCRFLEQSDCVGMCTNMCKIPSQTFIKDSFGVPFSMVPDFEDMSCEMIYGQEPPTIAEDPAFKQPCYELCKSKQRHNTRSPG